MQASLLKPLPGGRRDELTEADDMLWRLSRSDLMFLACDTLKAGRIGERSSESGSGPLNIYYFITGDSSRPLKGAASTVMIPTDVVPSEYIDCRIRSRSTESPQ